MGSDEIKVNKYDNMALKQTLDDAVVKQITENMGYKEDHNLGDWKILLGVIGCILALIAQFYPKPFPDNKIVLIICAVGYFTCSSLLTYLASYIQKDIILSTKANEDGKSLEVRSQMKRYEPDYSLTVQFQGESARASLKKQVNEWFDVNGVLAEDVFNNDVADLVQQLSVKKRK